MGAYARRNYHRNASNWKQPIEGVAVYMFQGSSLGIAKSPGTCMCICLVHT